jgi:uncharacterized protein
VYAAIGMIAGVASASLGIGGGVIVIPAISGFLGVPMRKAAGISIASVLGLVSVGVVSEVMSAHNIEWSLVLLLAAGAQIGVRIGNAVSDKVSERALRYGFMAILAFTAAKLSGLLTVTGASGLFPLGELWSYWSLAILGLGMTAGVISVLVGIGGGVVAVPGLLLLVDQLPFRAARATSLAMIVPTALAGTILHARRNNVLWRSVVPLAIPGCVGAVVGVLIANAAPNEIFRNVIFPLFMTITIIRLGLKKD